MSARPRIALSTGALRIPPTYFVLQHATLLAEYFEFEAFARIADVTDDSMGIPVHDATPQLTDDFGRRSRLSLLMGARARRQLEQFHPDLIHQHFGTWSGPAIAAARHLAVPLLTTVHGYDVFAALAGRQPSTVGGLRAAYGRRHHARSTLAAFDASKRVLAVSRYLADRAIEAGADPAKVVVHYQGIDAEYFRPAERPPVSDTEPLVLFVGALTELKGPQDLLEASLSLITQLPHRLVFVGEGPLAPALRARAATASHVRFAGGLPRDGVRDLMREARVMVLPTQEHGGRREAAGLVLLEAQACGTPVVTYASGGAPEMVDPDITGLIVEERDIQALESAIRSVIDLPDAASAHMADAAREWVVNERSLAHSARQLHAHYSELLGGG